MILDFSIQNFGPIKNRQTLSFEADASSCYKDCYIIHPKLMNGDLLLRQGKPVRLLKLAIIIGANASGKTTILEALDFFRQVALSKRIDKRDNLSFLPFLLDTDSRVFPTIFTIRFFHQGFLFEHELEINRYCVIREVVHFWDYNTTGRKRLLFERETEQYSENTTLTKINERLLADHALTPQDIEALEYLTFWNESVLVGINKINLPFRELTLMREWYSDVLQGMLDNGHCKQKVEPRFIEMIEQDSEGKDFMIAFLQEIDRGIQGFNIETLSSSKLLNNLAKVVANIDAALAKDDYNKQPQESIFRELQSRPLKWVLIVYQVMGNEYSLPLERAATGIKSAFRLAGLTHIMKQERKVMPIDAFEFSLQPAAVEQFLQRFVSHVQESQMIVTASSPELLQIKALVERRDIIWFTHKNERSESELYSLRDFPSELTAETSIYHCYQTGLFEKMLNSK